MQIRKLAFVFAAARCGLSGLAVASPPPWKDATAPTRSGTAAAVRNAIGPPMQYPCVPTFLFFATDDWLSSHPMKALASVMCVVGFSALANGRISAIAGVGPVVSDFLPR